MSTTPLQPPVAVVGMDLLCPVARAHAPFLSAEIAPEEIAAAQSAGFRERGAQLAFCATKNCGVPASQDRCGAAIAVSKGMVQALERDIDLAAREGHRRVGI